MIHMNPKAHIISSAGPVVGLDLPNLSAPELAEEIQASLRQVQIWTDQLVLHALPGTEHQGRGRKRLYDPLELALGNFTAVLARLKFPIGMLKVYTDLLRGFVYETQPEAHYEQRPRDWYRQARRGDFDSWLMCCPELVGGEVHVEWQGRKHFFQIVKTYRAGVLVDVRQVIAPFIR